MPGIVFVNYTDHDNLNLKVVIIQPTPPSKAMLEILSDPLFAINLTYLEGSVLNEKDIDRARADKAIGIFIMCNKNSLHADVEDSTTILYHFSLRKYLAQKDSNPILCTQLIRVESRRHMATGNNMTDLVICLNDIKMGIFAKACLHPGSSTLLFNLLSSFSDDNDEDPDAIAQKGAIKQGNDIIDTLANTYIQNWEDEYTKGCDWEIYISSLPKDFEGAKFCNLAYALYHKVGITLIGMRVEERSGVTRQRLLLNPGTMVIPSNEEFIVEAIVMAKNQESSDLTFENDPATLSQLVLIAKTSVNDTTTNSKPQNMSSSDSKESPVVDADAGRSSRSVFLSLKGSASSRNADHRKLSGSNRKSSIHNFMTVLLQRDHSSSNPRKSLSRKEKFIKDRTKGSKSSRDGAFVGGMNTYVSDQEKKQHDEDRYLERNYFRRAIPCDISSACVKMSIAEDFPYVKFEKIEYNLLL